VSCTWAAWVSVAPEQSDAPARAGNSKGGHGGSAEHEARQLLEGIDLASPVGLRDRALIALLSDCFKSQFG